MMESCYVDDAHLEEKATRIGQALAADAAAATTEKYFVRGHSVSVSDELTVREARAIAHNLKKDSHTIGTLEIKKSTDPIRYYSQTKVNGNVLQPLLEVAIQHFSKVHLRFDLNDDVAKTLGLLLLRLADNGAKHALQMLELHIGPYMTKDGALCLAYGLRHAKLKGLALNSIVVDDETPLNNVVLMIYQAALQSVEKLVLFDYLDDETATVIGNALVGNTTLQSFEFKLHDLSIDAATTLANGISRSHIIHLDMHENLCEDAEDILYEGVARSPTVRFLNFGNGFCGTPGLAQCLSRLYSLSMDYFSIKMEHLPSLMMGLSNAPCLTTLVLGHDFHAPQDIVCFCAALTHCPSLTDLTMCCKLAFDEEQLDNDDDDESVDYQFRRIQPTGAEHIMVTVAKHPSLVRLTLKSCSDIGFAGLAMIGMHLPNIKLKELCLELCDEYRTYGESESVQRAYQRACQAMVAGVQSNWHLHVLTSTCRRRLILFPSKVQEEVDFYLDLNKSGRFLLHDRDSENKVPTGLWCHVLAKCGDEAGLVYYHLREQPTLLMAAGMCHNKLDVKVAHGLIVPAGTKRRREE